VKKKRGPQMNYKYKRKNEKEEREKRTESYFLEKRFRSTYRKVREIVQKFVTEFVRVREEEQSE